MTALVFVSTRRQLDDLKYCVNCPENALLVSADYGVTLELRRQGRCVIDLLSFLSEDLVEKSEHLAWVFCRLIRAGMSGKVVYRGCDLIERSANELLYPIKNTILLQGLLEKFYATLGEVSIYHFPEMSNSYTWDFPADQPPDVFNAGVAAFAALKGCPRTELVCAHCTPSSRGAASAQASLPYKAGLGDFVGANIKRICLAPRFAAMAEMKVFIDREVTVPETDWLLITDDAEQYPVPTVAQNVLLGLPFDVRDVEEGAADLARQGFSSVINSRSLPDVAQLLSHPFLAFVWQSYCKTLPYLARWAGIAEFLSLSTNVDLVLLGYDALAVNRVLAESFAIRGIPSLSVDHVGCGIAQSLRRNEGGRADVAVWGDADAEGHKRWRDPRSRVWTVGSLRKDHAQLAPLLSSDPGGSGSPECPIAPTIVLFTSNVATLRTPLGTSTRLAASWDELLRFIATSRWSFRIKPHPVYDHHELYDDKRFRAPNIALLGGGGREGRRYSAREALEAASVAVLVNCPSTVGVDAIAMGVPVVFLKDVLWDSVKSPLEDGAAIVVSTVRDLELELTRILADDRYREEIVARQRQALQKILHWTGVEAVESMRMVVHSVARTANSTQELQSPMIACLELAVAACENNRSMLSALTRFRWCRSWNVQSSGRGGSLLKPYRTPLLMWASRLVWLRYKGTRSWLRALLLLIAAAPMLLACMVRSRPPIGSVESLGDERP
jgi:hypothetical protein